MIAFGEALEIAARRLFADDPLAQLEIRELVKYELRQGNHPEGLRAAKAAALKGQCIFCEDALRGRHRWVCGEADCSQTYMRAYRRDRRAR